MTQPATDAQPKSAKSRRGGAPKPYPSMKLEDALVLAKTIVNVGVGDQMRRLTLFSSLGKSPDSGPSRTLVAASSKYGLTSGGHKADHLVVTEDGKAIAASLPGLSGARERAFDCAVARIAPFSKLYDNLKNQRVPSRAILRDELTSVGIRPDDVEVAGDIFLANARYIGLIREVSGSERLVPIEQVLEEDPSEAIAHSVEPLTPPSSGPASTPVPEPARPSQAAPALPDPSMHIDIQIHIDSNASSEQIDKVFLSMAKYLYGRDV